ncbi:hypothetical protein [Mesorhizobium sp. LSJC264A00]|uniref:hypothetical protein n=1 Tax=unclassified Mesorhizobium TaxID=325217 RepID=UPI0003CF1660|nr:hypothetical protein [Mesorhizobium sp. LSJC264A00]ESX23315.1 hypothetical protein X767_16010 [Mesorhizobium sp. LSJC264A00]
MGAFKSDDLCGFWTKCTVSAGVPTNAASFNVTSITDTGPGILTVTIGTDFASANWMCSCAAEMTATTYAVANARRANIRNGSQAAGSVAIDCTDNTATTNLAVDPAAWHVSGFGVQ